MHTFITFEGGEGSGKSTQMKLLGDFLAEQKISVLLTQEPTGTTIGRKIGDILFHRSHTHLCPETELLLFCAARAQHVREIVQPALESGQCVLCDRFSDATFAYQSAGRGLDATIIRQLNDFSALQLKPDLTLLFDLPVETGLQRAGQRDAELRDPSTADRFEKEKLDFHRRVREAYLRLSEKEPNRFRVIDAAKSRTEVAEEVRRQVTDFLEKRR